MKLLGVLLSMLASILHLTLAIPLEGEALISQRSTLTASADCAGETGIASEVESKSQPVVCSEPVRPSKDDLYLSFLQAQEDMHFLVQFRAQVLLEPTDILLPFGKDGDSMYGLSKQASVGDMSLHPPFTMDPNEGRKAVFWKKYEGMGCDVARGRYVEQAEVFIRTRYESGMSE